MSTIKSLLVVLLCGCLVVACSGEDKKEPASDQAGVDKDDGDSDKKPIGRTDKSSGAAKKNPLGGLGDLMGGKKATGAKKKGLLGGLGVGDMLGGMGVAPAGAAGAPALGKADEVGTGKKAEVADSPPPVAPPVAAGQDCQALAAHLGKIIEKEMKSGQLQGMDMDPAMLAQVGPMMAMACQQQQWSPEARACILEATDAASIEGCEKLIGGMGAGDPDLGEDELELDDLDLSDLDLGDISTDPVPSGDAECDRVAVHLVDAMLEQMPADQAQAMGQMKVMIQNELGKECAKAPWPKSMRTCLLGATTDAAMEKCAMAAGMAD